MKKVLLLANFMDLDENTNNRFNYLAKLLKNECNLKIITSTFSHREKRQRNYKDISNINIHMLYEPGYEKNISLKRIYSHYVLARNLKKCLNNIEEKPDVIYCAVPSLKFAKETAKYAKKNKIRFIIDIQDLWPEAFKMVFNVPIISDLIFYPMMKQANYIYSNADEIVAVSNTYLNRALSVNKKCNKGLSVFLGTDLNYFDKCKINGLKKCNDQIIKIAYIGTLGYSYDIISVMKAIKLLNNKGIKNIKFIIMGDGPLRNRFENFAKKNDINCEFTGRLEYEKMIGVLCSCDIAVNPINKGSAGSIINKVGDYAMAGLPVVNTQECPEYKELLSKYEAGVNAMNGNALDISEKIKFLILNKKVRENMGKNNRRLAIEKFDREKTYNQIVKIMEGN